MSTRGLVGFVIDGSVKATYNHFDSYPGGLGSDVVKVIQSGELDVERVRSLVMVSGDERPTAEQQVELMQFANVNVSSGDLSEWYVLLRELQGDLLGSLAAGVMIDKKDFAGDSLFCEWGYLVNMDEEVLEVYRGFVTEKSESVGRFAGMEPYRPEYTDTVYYPITLIRTIPFAELDGAMQEIEDAEE